MTTSSPVDAVGDPPVGRPTGKKGKDHRDSRWLPYVLLIPAILLELLIHIFPMLTGVWMSFVKMNKNYIARWSEAPWSGLHNFKVAIDQSTEIGRSLWHSFWITCIYTVLVVFISWAFGMLAAVVLQRSFKGRGLLRTFFLIPYALPMYAGVIAWNFMLQQNTGAINHVLVDQLHLMSDGPFWLIGNNAFFAVVIVAIWRMWPFAFLMLMAGLQAIPEDVYEASAVDGARAWAQWRKITLPMLRSVNTVLILVMFLWTFNDFNTPFVLFGQSQPPNGDLISYHIYNASFLTMNFGLGSAMSVMLLLFLLVVTGIYLVAINRRARRA